MSTVFIGTIKAFSFNYPPKGWAQCDGQQLSINQNQALFAILGTTYGGNGTTTFALPDLRGRTPLHVGSGIVLGQKAGEAQHTLLTTELPSHIHLAQGDSATVTTADPTGHTWGTQANNAYATGSPNNPMNPSAISNNGSSQPHNNMQPYQVLNFCICLQGTFPVRN